MQYFPLIAASALLALFIITKLFGGRSLNSIRANTVGHGQHGSARWATKREVRRYYTMVPYEPQKWRGNPEQRPNQPGFILGTWQHGWKRVRMAESSSQENNYLQDSASGVAVPADQALPQTRRNRRQPTLRHRNLTAWVDAGDSHAMMIASPGGGKTAYFLYPNIEYAMACGVSFVTLDTKGDLYRNMAVIGEKYYGYRAIVYDFRKPTESDTYNLMSLVNKYMDRFKQTGSVDDKARAEKQARMVAKSIITGGVDMANMGANSFFYEASESLLTSAIMILSEYGEPGTRHISSAHKLIDAVSVKKKGEPNLYAQLLSALPPYHKAAMLAGSAVNSAEQTTASIVSTAHTRLNELIDSELEQMICFDTAFAVEDFIEHPTGVYIVLPEEDTTKYFIVSLVIQQINAELTAMADRLGGTLPKKVLCFYDELGTIPKIEGLDAIFTASRSRNMSIVGILQGTSQLKERYGEETAETIFNSCHDTIAGAFGPLSQDAEFLSKQLGSRTARTGSVTTDGKTGEQSSTQQMMEVPLMAPNELREMPKGDFVLLKTFCRSVRTHMPLFTEWGITTEEKYHVQKRPIREIRYMDVAELMRKVKGKTGGTSGTATAKSAENEERKVRLKGTL